MSAFNCSHNALRAPEQDRRTLVLDLRPLLKQLRESFESAPLEASPALSKGKRPLTRGDHLFRIGAPFQSLFAVRSGSLKTYATSEEGQEQVMGFHLPGELVGLDAIADGFHPLAARALETTSVCEIPFKDLETLSVQLPGLQRQLLRVMSQEIRDDEQNMVILGQKSAEERLASFLIGLSDRFRRRGFSATQFNLSMSRSDIGNYLGLAVETVSRLFTRFQEEGILEANRKHIRILDLARLTGLAGTNRSE